MLKGKTVLLRVDMNCPIHPDTHEILGAKRIEEVVETINALDGAKIVVISHQGRVGRDDFVGMEEHAKQLEKFSNKKVRYVADVIGSLAQKEIKEMSSEEIILLDNLRLCAEENYEFSLEESARTIMVQRLKDLFDLFILDSFPSAHRTHPSLVGFCTSITNMCRTSARKRSETIRQHTNSCKITIHSCIRRIEGG